MSSFTDPITVQATSYKDRKPSWLPPAWQPENWVLGREFTYAVGSLEEPEELITVPKGFVFNGHSVPVVFLWLVSRSHSLYVQAAALHDWLYADPDWMGTRAEADAIYYEALRLLGVPSFWAWCMWGAVRIGGMRAWEKDQQK